MIRFAVAIGLSSFLIFQVQPIIARVILPWYGGTAAVWSTCLLFFQAALLAGYGYAHFIRLNLAPKTQVIVHVSLLAASLLLLPISPDPALMPTPDSDPIGGILWLLLLTVGVPYWLVSASGPLLQHWFSLNNPGRDPYRLYALSNAASLLGLLSYPFLVEPNLTLGTQSWTWSVGYGLYGLACLWCGWKLSGSPGAIEEAKEKTSDKPEPEGRTRPIEWLAWVVLAAAGSILLLATTNQMTQDLAVTPFMWVLPLSLYLITFIICFDRETWYDRRVWAPLFIASVIAVLWFQDYGGRVKAIPQMIVYSAALLTGCMVVHGEMVRLKPPPSRLTSFYLMVALGGALGGVSVTLLAPEIFDGYWELYVGFVIAMAVLFGQIGKEVWKRYDTPARVAWTLIWIVAAGAMAMAMMHRVEHFQSQAITTVRNFYGVLRVHEYAPGKEYWERSLVHGRIVHGNQNMFGEHRLDALSYYGPGTGIEIAIEHHPRRMDPNGMNIGVIGLGAGTLASYGYSSDKIRIYEINPAVEKAAREQFTYLRDSSADVQVVLGDARLVLQRELESGEGGNFDILAVDAFSGDAIPIHLLTREALDIYRGHLSDQGVLAVHITNRHVNLWPIVWSLAREANMQAIFLANTKDETLGTSSSDWILLSHSPEALSHEAIQSADVSHKHLPVENIIWTDDYSNLLSVMF